MQRLTAWLHHVLVMRIHLFVHLEMLMIGWAYLNLSV